MSNLATYWAAKQARYELERQLKINALLDKINQELKEELK